MPDFAPGEEDDNVLVFNEEPMDDEWEMCDECGGSGFISDENGTGQCEACGGMGEVLIDD